MVQLRSIMFYLGVVCVHVSLVVLYLHQHVHHLLGILHELQYVWDERMERGEGEGGRGDMTDKESNEENLGVKVHKEYTHTRNAM